MFTAWTSLTKASCQLSEDVLRPSSEANHPSKVDIVWTCGYQGGSAWLTALARERIPRHASGAGMGCFIGRHSLRALPTFNGDTDY